MTMMTRRSAHDELRREGEARTRRAQEVTKELSGWRHRLQTATTRQCRTGRAQGGERKPSWRPPAPRPPISPRRANALMAEIDTAETRRKAAADALAGAETALREAALAEREVRTRRQRGPRGPGRADARAEAARETVADAAERIAEATGQTPADLLETLKIRSRQDARRRGDRGGCEPSETPARRPSARSTCAPKRTRKRFSRNTTRWSRKGPTWKRRSRACAPACASLNREGP